MGPGLRIERAVTRVTAAVGVAVIGALGAPARLAAQTVIVRPDTACADCDTASVGQDERRLVAARADLERARQGLLEAIQRMASSRDTLGLTAETLARAQGQLRRAEERYGQLTAELLQRRLQAAATADAATAATLRALSSADDEPAGWLGVTLSAGARAIERVGGRAMMRFDAYPTIESVDPDSPAERAGLQAGDKLLALDGQDLTTGCEPLSTLLKPGAHLRLRVKRGGYTKQLLAVIARRPQSEWVWNWRVTPAPDAPPAPGAPVALPAPDESPAPPPPDVRVFLNPMPAPLAIETVRGMSMAGDVSVVAGAEVRPVGSLADYFGVHAGVLVLHVVPGSVASRSGLRDGDVIVNAGGVAVGTPAALSRSIYRASDVQQLKLDIVRLKKRRSVLLKWDGR